MIWFGKSFIKFCKNFINLLKLFSTRTCSSARVRVWGMSIKNLTSFGSDLASVMDLKRIILFKSITLKLHTVYAVISGAIKPLQVVGEAADFKFESKFEPLLVIWQSL